jgi:hypothetical protein
MALGTAPHQDNPRMPAPGAEHKDAPVEFDKDQPIDPVHLLRLYGDKAKSLEEMRAMALKDAAATQAAAEASVASKDVPPEEQMGEPGVTPAPPPAAPRHPQQHDEHGRH